MSDAPALLDSDTTSELSRGNPVVSRHARAYLSVHGRFTISVVTVFERLRGYRDALRRGLPFDDHLRRFEMFAASCVLLAVDERVADTAATLWAGLSVRRRTAMGDILIAATAISKGLPLVTRNRRDFAPMKALADLSLVDWSRSR